MIDYCLGCTLYQLVYSFITGECSLKEMGEKLTPDETIWFKNPKKEEGMKFKVGDLIKGTISANPHYAYTNSCLLYTSPSPRD